LICSCHTVCLAPGGVIPGQLQPRVGCPLFFFFFFFFFFLSVSRYIYIVLPILKNHNRSRDIYIYILFVAVIMRTALVPVLLVTLVSIACVVSGASRLLPHQSLQTLEPQSLAPAYQGRAAKKIVVHSDASKRRGQSIDSSVCRDRLSEFESCAERQLDWFLGRTTSAAGAQAQSSRWWRQLSRRTIWCKIWWSRTPISNVLP
jgi:hypothetical protein